MLTEQFVEVSIFPLEILKDNSVSLLAHPSLTAPARIPIGAWMT
jgi:hypothetical protein